MILAAVAHIRTYVYFMYDAILLPSQSLHRFQFELTIT